MNYKLDNWDFKIISIFKSCVNMEQEEDQIKRVWAERCAVGLGYVKLPVINGHLLDVVYGLNLLNTRHKFVTFISELNPELKSMWNPRGREKGKNYDQHVLSHLGSLLALAEAKHLPGYREWHLNETGTTAAKNP